MTFAVNSRAAALAAALALASHFAVAQEQDAAQGADAGQAQQPQETPDISTVLATVDGDEITLGELILMRANLPEEYQRIPPEQLLPALLDQAVSQRLLAEQGREAGYDETPLAKLRAELDRRNFLAESAMRDVIREATTEDRLQTLYEEAIADMEPTPEVRASHILVENKEEAEALMEELEGGADFAELASERSTGPSGAEGGELGWFDQSQMVAPFADAAFGAEVGEVVGPVETRFGWHVIKVTGKRERPLPTFEEMREDLTRQAASAAVESAVAEAKDAAEVEIRETGLNPEVIRRDDLLTGE